MADTIPHSQMTLEELNLFKLHHRKFEYLTSEAQQLVDLVRKFVNPRCPSCLTCNSNLRDVKNDANTYYLLIRDIVMERLTKEQTELDMVAETKQKEVKTTPKKK